MEVIFKSKKREEIIDITSQIKEAVKGKTGKACLIYTPHTTCSVIINEISDEAVCEDLLNYLRKQIPAGKWKHDLGEGNADAHIKASLIGSSQLIPIKNGKLGLGKWQGIGLAEFDGPRERKVIIEVL